jgi:hypothetical protein
MGCCCITTAHFHKRTRVKPAFYQVIMYTHRSTTDENKVKQTPEM